MGKEVIQRGGWRRCALLSACTGINGREEVANCFLWVDRSAEAAGGTVVGVSFELRNGSTAVSPGQALLSARSSVKHNLQARNIAWWKGTFGVG